MRVLRVGRFVSSDMEEREGSEFEERVRWVRLGLGRGAVREGRKLEEAERWVRLGKVAVRETISSQERRVSFKLNSLTFWNGWCHWGKAGTERSRKRLPLILGSY